MKAIRCYPALTQAYVAKRALDAAAVLSLVIHDPRTQRAQVLVPEELVAHARSIVDSVEH